MGAVDRVSPAGRAGSRGRRSLCHALRRRDRGPPGDAQSTVTESQSAEVVTLGETMVLFWPAGDEPLGEARLFARSCAGAESNLCIALSRLGRRARWISRLGDDPFGAVIRLTLTAEGVEVIAPADTAAPTGVFFKERRVAGPRSVWYYRAGSAASRLGPDEIAAPLLAGARVAHVTGITPALSPSCRQAVERFVTVAHAAGLTVTFDPNVRPRLWPSAETCREALLPLMCRADVVLLGHEDAEVLLPGIAEADVPAVVAALGPRTVVLKLGERGAVGLREDERVAVEAVPVTVVDTVGAGDGFDAGFIAGLLGGMPLRACLQLGARIGAAAVAHAGDWEGYPVLDSSEVSRMPGVD